MKKIVLSLMTIVALMFVGCSAMDATYGKTKEVYKAGKTVYKSQPIKSNRLEAIGKTAEAYDDLREEVRGQ